MPKVSPKEFSRDLPTIGELAKAYEALPFSYVRAHLSEIVERVAYSGDPVMISKHNRPRAAVVPLSTLAQARANLLELARRSLEEKVEDEDRETAEKVDFEEVPGLSAEEIQKARHERDAAARDEDRMDEEFIRLIVSHPMFEQSVEIVLIDMLNRGFRGTTGLFSHPSSMEYDPKAVGLKPVLSTKRILSDPFRKMPPVDETGA